MWQIVSRLAPGALVYNWVNESRFLVKKGETGLTGNIYTGLHEFKDMAFVLHFLRRGDLFVDVGANAGSYTILACAVVGADGIAFEPVPDAFGRLLDNMRINDLSQRVSCIRKCVGEKAGAVEFTSNRDTTNRVHAVGDTGNDLITVEQTTLDSELVGQTPCLMKIDVEGYEAAVLAGASKTLDNPSLKAVILEISTTDARGGIHDTEVARVMEQKGFSACFYDPLNKCLTQPMKITNRDFGNTLFIRDKQFVEQRLADATDFLVHGWQI